MEHFVGIKNLAMGNCTTHICIPNLHSGAKKMVQKVWRAESSHIGNVLKEALARLPCFVGQ